jgi:Mn-dependent DtxR family transcriptional regulator
MEDYLEVICEIPTKRCVTTADISKYLNVSSPRVSRIVKKLNEKQDLIMKSTVIQDQHLKVSKLQNQVLKE